MEINYCKHCTQFLSTDHDCIKQETLIDQLAKQKRATLPEEYLSKQYLIFLIPTEGDLAGLRFVKYRYLDGAIMYDNMEFIGDSETAPYQCKIDASAVLLSYLCGETGLSMLSSSEFRENLAEIQRRAYNMEGTAFDMITLECENEE